MATTKKTHTGNGSTTNYTFDFPYIKQADVKVTLDNVATTAYTFANATTISFTSAPANNAAITIYRSTDDSNLVATFYPGSAIRSSDLNDNYTQNLYSTQENTNDATDALDNSRALESGVYVTAIAKSITALSTANTASTNATNAVSTANSASSSATTAVNTANTANTTAGNAVTTANAALPKAGGTMTGDIVFEGAEDDAHETTLTVIDPTADRTITLPNVTGTVPVLAAISNTQITSTPEELNILDGVTSTAAEINILDGVTSTTAEINLLDGVTSTTAELNILDGVTSTAAEINILDGVTAGAAEINLLDGVTSTTAELNILDGVTSTAAELNILDGVTSTTAELNHVAGVTSNVQTQLNAKQASAANLTTLAGMQSGTASVLADSTALTSTNAELNLLDGKSVVTSVSGSSTDVQLPTAKAVNDQIVSLLNDAGGFHPILDDQKFPNTNPDPDDTAGTIVSIADAGGLVVNGSGVSTTGRTLGGSTVTINGIDSSLNNTTIAAGKGMLVQTTSTLNIYDYHRLVVDEAGVAGAQTLVSDFNDRYRVNAGEPSSHLTDGDLVFDTSANKMKVYDATASAWKEVTSAGDFKYLFLCPTSGSGAPSFPGASYDLREGSNSGSAASITSAAQLMVSVNGVVQKANTGTSAPAEGFALVDSNSIIFGANIAATDSVFIVQFGSALTITTPGDNTVSAAKIQSGAVETAKIANDAVDGSKLANNIDIAGTLDVTGVGTFDSHINLPNVNTFMRGGGHDVIQVDATRTYFYGGSNGVQLRKADNSTEIVTVDDSGNTVIGPWNEVSASGEGFTLRSRGQLLQQLKSDTSEASAYVLQKGTASKITFTPDGDGTFSGRVGIANTTASSFTANTSDNLVVGSGSGGEGITIYCATDNQGALSFADGTSGDAAYRGAIAYIHSSDSMDFRTAGVASRLVIDSSGNAAFAGSVKIGGTAAANEIDEYEEGTWTPGIGGNATYTTQTGTYTRIGRFVFITCHITINSRGTGSTIAITSLPFAATGGLENTNVVGYWSSSAVSSTAIMACTNSSEVVFTNTTAAQAGSSLNAGIIQDSTDLRFALHYRI